jgi:hypothetical protein
MSTRRGRTPGGRSWGPEQERLHPRDDRGRFAKKGGGRWAARVVKSFEAGLGDTSMHQPGSTITAGRRPGGLIDLKALGERGRKARQNREFIELAREIAGTPTHISQVEIGDQVKVDHEWRDVWGTGSRNGVSYINWRDAQGVKRGEINESDQPTVFVQRAPKFEATKALKAGGEQERRMDAWRADAQKPPPFRSMTQGEANMRDRENDVAAAQSALDEATRKARTRANRKYPKKHGYPQGARDEYIDRETWEEQHTLGMAKATLEYARNAEPSKYDSQIDTLHPPKMDENVDRSRPLALYGDMLHARAYDEASFRALAELESIPFELHQIVAAAMVRRRETLAEYRGKAKGNPGIYVGNGGSADLLPEYFADFAHERPRGWSEGDTYYDVSGTFSPQIFAIAIGHTKNREGAEHSAAEHEFGHALDMALGEGQGQSRYGPNYDARASHTPEWEALHDRVLANHGPGLSPYFQQEGDAGRQEFFAEAFAVWVDAYRKAIASERVSDVKSPDPDNYYGNRAARALKRKFDVKDWDLLSDLHSYFLKLSAGAGVQW